MRDASDAALRTAQGSARYRVEGEIARGGMGVVYRAFDQATGRVVALKRPLVGDSSTTLPRHVALLEREFRTLAAIKHPRVIEVYDYGIDDEGPYYTMELLDGDDLKAKSPVPWREVCAYMRDIASCLALLHARGLVHRDVSPSNIRLTSDGRAKLIDFGALVPFGRHDVVAGTPAGVAPEALDSLDIDQRVDLYALGATAYHALTGRAAYPARALTQLHALWAQGKPPPPSKLVPGVPEALDELVLSLLSLDPLSRPASAAEVIDRLGVIAELPSDDDQAVLRSFLQNPVLVGRDEARARLNARVKRMLSGRGSVLLIEAAVGYGKTALLAELDRESRLLGARVLSVNARAHQARFGTCRALLEQAMLELPERAAQLIPNDLFEDAPGFASASEPPRTPSMPVPLDDTVERLSRAFLALAEELPLVLSIDDADHIDVDSAAVLTSLAEQCASHKLCLVLSADDESANDQVALRALRRLAVRVRLTPLVAADVERLVRTTFGDAPSGKRLAAWLVEQTNGSPMSCMELLSELVDRKIVRYEGGAWVLPQELPKQPAASTSAVLERRLKRLSDNARVLASCMSAQRGSVSVGVCRALAQRELALDPAETSRVLDELVTERVLVGDGRYFAFTQAYFRDVLYGQLEPARRARVHRLFGEHLARELGDDPCRWLEVGCHFSFAGDEKTASRYLRPAISTLTRRGEALVRAVPDLEALWAHYRAQGLSERDQLRACMPLVIAGLYVNPAIQDAIGERTLDVLEEQAGITLAKRLVRWLPAMLALAIGVVYGYVRYLFMPRTYRFNTFSYPLAYFGASASIDGTAALRLDRRVHEALAQRLSFVRGLSLHHAARMVYEIVHLAPLYARGCFAEAFPRLMDTLKNLARVRLDPNSRAQFEHALRFWAGRVGLLRFGAQPLEQAERMANSPSHHDRILAEFLRFAYHLGRGETAAAEPFREKLDALAARYGASWVADLLLATEFVPYHLSGDVVGLKRCVLELEVLVTKHPSLQTALHIARAMYEGHRGRPEQALAIYRELGARIAPFADPLWSHAQAHMAECLNALGRHAEALACVERALAVVGEARHDFVMAYQQLEREQAIARAGLGNIAQAANQLDELLDKYGDLDQPLLIGLLHRDRARVALADRDRDAFFMHADEARVRFRTARNPALVAQARRLSEQAQKAGLEAESVRSGQDFSEDFDLVLPPTSVRSDDASRGQRVLNHVVALVGASRARLYVLRDGQPVLLAQHGADEWDLDLEDDVDELIRSFAHQHEQTAERANQILNNGEVSVASHTLVPLVIIENNHTRVVGALAVSEAPRLRDLTFDRLERLARVLVAEQGALTALEAGRP